MQTYFKRWLVASTKMNFYDWLDRGEGNSLDLEERPRHVLSKQHVHYCTEQERSYLEVVVGPDGLLRYKVGGDLVDTGSEVCPFCPTPPLAVLPSGLPDLCLSRLHAESAGHVRASIRR